MMTKTHAALAAAAILTLLAGCAVFEDRPSSRIIAQWGPVEIPDLMTDATEQLQTTRLVLTAQERDDVLGLVPTVPQADRDKVEAIDLASHVVVFGFSQSCGLKASHIGLRDDAVEYVLDYEEGVMCAVASPLIEVWEVDRRDLPTPITLADQTK